MFQPSVQCASSQNWALTAPPLAVLHPDGIFTEDKPRPAAGQPPQRLRVSSNCMDSERAAAAWIQGNPSGRYSGRVLISALHLASRLGKQGPGKES